MLSTLGDLSQSFLLRSHNKQLRTDLDRLASELSSGRVEDISKHLGGNLNRLNDVTRQIEALGAYKLSADEFRTTLEIAQLSLSQVSDAALQLADDGVGIENMASNQRLDRYGDQARQGLESMISALNARSAGMSIFAGTAGSSSALNEVEDIMSDVSSEILSAGATTAADVETVIDDWLNAPGGGFETVAYAGNQSGPSERQVGEIEKASLGIRGDDQRFRSAMKAFLLTSFAKDQGIGLSREEREDIAMRGAELSRTGHDEIISLQGDIGVKQERLEIVSARNAAEENSLQILYNELVSADAYTTASQFEEARTRLETHYTITARLSGLSLTNFLR